jgi:uncharacterized repeat protein (TIGR03803 family)
VKPVHVVCLCLMLARTVVLAQSGPTRPAYQANGLPVELELQPSTAQVPQGVPFGQLHRGRAARRHLKPPGQTGPEQVLYAFQGGNDGSSPSSGLILDSSGNLYGTTENGGGGTDCSGNYAGCGTVFELSPNGSGGWTETILYSFQGGSDGALPTSGLVFDQAGNLYGTTRFGGGTFGTVFELSPKGSGGWTETILYTFTNNSDGAYPQGLIFDQKGNLYGTTVGGGGLCGGGFNPCGTVFELSPNGSGGWTETSLYVFQVSDGIWNPNPGLVFDQAGNLFGTTPASGENGCVEGYGCGAVFELSPNGSGGWKETLLFSFQGGSDGVGPNPGLMFDQAGNLYGTAQAGGRAATRAVAQSLNSVLTESGDGRERPCTTSRVAAMVGVRRPD